MRLEILKEWERKNVEVVLINKFSFKGELKKVSEFECIIFDVIKNCEVIVSLEAIVTINKYDKKMFSKYPSNKRF